jgi:N-acetylglucosaminyldiphosphoundecaprenol N-acetyl-beta-D-mannosaminyltransferase
MSGNTIALQDPLVLASAADVGLLRLADASMGEAVGLAERLIAGGGRHYCCFCEASLFSSVIWDTRVRSCVQSAAAVFPDGIALMILSRLHGHKLSGRVPGPSFLLAACEYGVTKGWRHFFYGGAPGVAESLSGELKVRFPGLVVAGTYSPPFRELDPGEELKTKAMIEAARPDLLWVCLGSPKQELWCARNVGRIKVPLMLPVGAAFDFHSGHRRWAPRWIRKIGMEWAFRALTGGRRTFFRNVRCVSIVAAYLALEAVRCFPVTHKEKQTERPRTCSS